MPSGLTVTLHEVLFEEDPPLARFRFVAPDIGPVGKAFAEVVDDIDYLCSVVVVPSLAANEWEGDRVVISLSSEEVPFGTSAPDVAQYFQPFAIEDGACAWLDF